MELKIIKPKVDNIKLKLTLQKTGKLGFSAECNRLFNLDENKYIKFATDSENNPYLKLFNLPDDETFTIAKAGPYFYIKKSDSLLKGLGISINDKVTFDLVKSENEFFAMLKRYYK